MDELKQAIAALAARLGDAANGLATIEVLTLSGNEALRETVREGVRRDGAGRTVPQGSEGAYTALNLITGDVVSCYSEGVADAAVVRALHAEAVRAGSQALRENAEMLKTLLLELLQRQRQEPG